MKKNRQEFFAVADNVVELSTHKWFWSEISSGGAFQLRENASTEIGGSCRLCSISLISGGSRSRFAFWVQNSFRALWGQFLSLSPQRISCSADQLQEHCKRLPTFRVSIAIHFLVFCYILWIQQEQPFSFSHPFHYSFYWSFQERYLWAVKHFCLFYLLPSITYYKKNILRYFLVKPSYPRSQGSHMPIKRFSEVHSTVKR